MTHAQQNAHGSADADRDALALAGSLTTVGYAMFALLQAGPLPETPVQVVPAPAPSPTPVSAPPPQPQADSYAPAYPAEQPPYEPAPDAAPRPEQGLYRPAGAALMDQEIMSSLPPPEAAPVQAPVVQAPPEKISTRQMQDFLSELSELDDL